MDETLGEAANAELDAEVDAEPDEKWMNATEMRLKRPVAAKRRPRSG